MNVSMAVAGDLQPAAIDLVLAVARKAGAFCAFKTDQGNPKRHQAENSACGVALNPDRRPSLDPARTAAKLSDHALSRWSSQTHPMPKQMGQFLSILPSMGSAELSVRYLSVLGLGRDLP